MLKKLLEQNHIGTTVTCFFILVFAKLCVSPVTVPTLLHRGLDELPPNVDGSVSPSEDSPVRSFLSTGPGYGSRREERFLCGASPTRVSRSCSEVNGGLSMDMNWRRRI